MRETYTERARAAEELAAKARNDGERRAFEEIAWLWRRLAGGASAEPQEARTFASR